MNPCLFFDLDGTLADTGLDLAFAVNLMRQTYGLEKLNLEAVLSYVGHGLKNTAARATEGCGINPDEAYLRLLDAYAEHLTDKTTLYPGVAETLSTLKEKGYRLAVLTNKKETFSRTILSHLGLASLFDIISGATEGRPLKPDPLSVKRILNQLHIQSTEDCWMIGDSSTDMTTAINANLKGCFCTYGFRGTTSVRCDAKINAFPELLDVLP